MTFFADLDRIVDAAEKLERHALNATDYSGKSPREPLPSIASLLLPALERQNDLISKENAVELVRRDFEPFEIFAIL